VRAAPGGNDERKAEDTSNQPVDADDLAETAGRPSHSVDEPRPTIQ
jgi:hypothetical protein